jgi:aryl-alcohol dehydrogenase-like predicted oxidoreductase
MRVSRIALGTALIGLVPPEDESVKLIQGAFDEGINVFDCANTYGNRASFDRPGMPSHEQRKAAEEILATALKGHRDDIVLCTKVSEPVGPGVNDGALRSGGLSRYHVMREVERSLRRLGTDHIDIYHAHHPDPATGIEETLETFDDLVRQGKVRYVALSTYNAWQMTHAVMTADARHLARPVLNQQHYNMLSRGVEAEVVPAALELGIQLTCFSPLAGGALAGSDAMSKEYTGVKRWGMDRGYTDAQKQAVEQLETVAKAWGYAPPHLALHWLLSRPTVSMAIIGPESLDQLKMNLGALDVTLDANQTAELDEIGKKPLPSLWD